jgi:hypothetical protein
MYGQHTGVYVIKGRERFARLLKCYYQTVRVIGNINGEKLLIAANFEFFDRSILLDFSLTSHQSFFIISRSS